MKILERKLFQLIISRLDGERTQFKEYREEIFELINKGIGGFILFGGEKERIKDLIEKMQSISEIPLFIASDIEHGAGQQITNATYFPCQMAIASAIDRSRSEDVAILKKVIKSISDEAIDIGINMPLIPVFDVNKNPINPIICTRAFSDKPEEVSWFGSEYVKILEESGLISCAKHFPGHGDTSVDSHIELPIIRKSFMDIWDQDINPFITAIHSGVSSIMIGHLLIPEIDYLPSTLSKRIITDLLRNKLSFDGLILTDALNMHALKKFKNVPTLCVQAGIDILLHPENIESTVDDLKLAIRSKKINEDIIESSLNRIMKVKENLKKQIENKVNYEENSGLSRVISDMSITLVKENNELPPLLDKENIQIFIAGEFPENSTILFEKNFKCLKNNKNGIVLIGKENVESIDILSKNTIIIALFTHTAAWRGSSDIDSETKENILIILKRTKQSVLISFGSPYVLRHFNEAGALIAAYEQTEQAIISTIKCLKGEIDFKGKLPVYLR